MAPLAGTIYFSKDEGDIFRCVELFCQLRDVSKNQKTDKRLWRLKKTICERTYKRVKNLGRTVESLERNLKLRIKLWTTKRIRENGSRLRIIVPFREPFDEGEMVDDGKIIHLFKKDLSHKSFSGKGFALIENPKIFFSKNEVRNITEEADRLKKTLFEAVVLETHKNLAGPKFDEKVRKMEEKWGKTFFEISEIKRFQKMFNIGLEIWSFEYVSEGDRNRRYSTLEYRSPHKRNVSIELEDFDIMEQIPTKLCLTYIPDTSRMSYFACPTPKCLFGTSRRYNYIRHTESCTGESKVSCNQKKIEVPDNLAREALAREGILPSADFQNTYYSVYDVESLMKDSTKFWYDSVKLHRLASIAVVSNLATEKEVFFYRRNMKPSSLKLLIQEFWEHLTEIRKEMWSLLPESIHKGYVGYLEFVKTETYKKASPEQKNLINKKISVLRKIRALRCYSWNGERYDANILLTPLIDYFSKDEKKFSKMSAIKRKAGFMHISYDGIHLQGKLTNYYSELS